MARFLFLAKNTPRSGREVGDPVGAFDDTHEFGEREDYRVWRRNGNSARDWPGIFWVLDIPGMPISEAEKLLEPHTVEASVGDVEFNESDAADRSVIVRRHRWQLNVGAGMPANQKATLIRNHHLTIPYNARVLDEFFIDRSKGAF